MRNIIIITVLIILTGCRHSDNKTMDTEKTRIKVVPVQFEKSGFPVRAGGLVVPSKEVRLSFKTGGIIAALHADDGDRVKKGTLLATLNLSEIEAQVAQAQNGYDKALRDYTRARNLYADSVATLEQLQNAETAVSVAKANLKIASFNLNHSKITAPDDGVILKRLAEPNEIIAPGYPVFLFGTTGNQWKVRAGIADRDFVKVMPGDSASIALDAYPGEKFRAVVSQLSEAANTQTGTYEVELDLVPVNKRLASGFVAKLEIFPSHADSYYRIPVEAIVEADGHIGYVFAVSDSGKAQKVKVDIVAIFNTWAAISNGLEGIDEVAAEGAAYLSDGEYVTVVR